MCKQGHISSSPWLNEWGSSPGLETTWCLSRTSFGSMTMIGRAAMTGNVTRIRSPKWNEFVYMYLLKYICPNVFLKMYLSNCICQNVFFCLSISLIKCLKGQKCLGLLFNVKNQKVAQRVVSEWVSDRSAYWAVCGQLKRKLQNLFWCL